MWSEKVSEINEHCVAFRDINQLVPRYRYSCSELHVEHSCLNTDTKWLLNVLVENQNICILFAAFLSLMKYIFRFEEYL